ncbi:3-methyl-2-oxobutanoate hydroxymethyltransferase [subsurface metagenome]
MAEKKVTTSDLVEMKKKGEKITMLTAYDHLMASQLDNCGIDLILVGDSVGTLICCVIFFASFAGIFSSTIENTPASSSPLASSNIFKACSLSSPLTP